ncbi:MAG: hypothetical protein HZA04_07555 [Nitrospinae bacterium]|nr:hypothetical protein [Nitrospinota bacterium]
MDWNSFIDGQTIATALFALEFLIVLYYAVVSITDLVRVEMDMHNRYRERAAFLNDFFRIYLERRQIIEEELHKEEEARQARLAAENA